MDWQMKRMVSFGIIKQGATSHTSPVFLIGRKQTQDKRPLVDFKLLNTRVKRQNTASPLLRDIYQMQGASKSNILSCVDLKDAFHSLRLTEKAKDFCGILPFLVAHITSMKLCPWDCQSHHANGLNTLGM